MNSYIPGVCNIGEEEINLRRKFGFTSFSIAVLIIIIFFLLGVPTTFRIIVAIPIATSAFSFLQAYFHFCANFGLRGVFNFSDKINTTEIVAQKEYRLQDQMMAIKIILLSMVISIVVTFILLLI